MSSETIELADELLSFVNDQVRSGRHRDAIAAGAYRTVATEADPAALLQRLTRNGTKDSVKP